MLTTLRKWWELTQSEKENIIARMFSVRSINERDTLRKTLAAQYEISEATITSFIAHETMRRNKMDWNKLPGSNNSSGTGSHITAPKEYRDDATKPIKNSIRARVYAITSISELSGEMRASIIGEFSDVIQNSTWNMRYDFYEDMEAISDYYNISPDVVESFVRNTYKWIWIRLDDLKKWKPLTEEEKMSIRRYVTEWKDEKDKKQRRKEMARKHDVSTHVIWAITAWKLWENGEKILGKDSIWSAQFFQNTPSVWWENPPIPWESLQESEVWDAITSEQSIDDKIGEGDSLVNMPSNILSDEDKEFIWEFASEYNLQDDSQRSDFLQSIFNLFPDATIQEIKEILPNFPDDQIHTNPKRSWEWMGALVNYNNEIKNKWRQKLKEFIDENTEKEKRKNMKVLCLPGVECLEIPLYIELWFTPENIIGVEAGIVKWKRDSTLIERFKVNAAKYWIQTRIWKLEEILETEDTVFDVVSLDFLGPVSMNMQNMLWKIKSSPKTIVLLNYLAKRESDLGKAILKLWVLASKKSDAPISRWYSSISIDSNIAVENRDIAVPHIIQNKLGESVRSTQYFDYKSWIPWKLTLEDLLCEHERLHKLWEIPFNDYNNHKNNARFVIWHYRALFVERMTTDSRKYGWKCLNHYHFEKPLTMCFYWVPVATSLQQLRYLSKVGQGHGSSFFSELMVLDRPEDDFRILDEYLRFFTDFLVASIKNHGQVDCWMDRRSGKPLCMFYKINWSLSKKRFVWDSIIEIYRLNHEKFHHRSILEDGCSNKYNGERLTLDI